MIESVDVPFPVEYLKTGDHALLVAWTSIPQMVFVAGDMTPARLREMANWLKGQTEPKAILCLEDGSAVIAEIGEFKFDYRYDINKGKFVDVSGVGEGEGSGDTDQAAPDHGGEAVSELVSEPD